MKYPIMPGDGLDEDADDFDELVLERVQQFRRDSPMPGELRKQIENWIEPQTEHTETDHEDVMKAIGIAYPLIVAWHAERQEAAAR